MRIPYVPSPHLHVHSAWIVVPLALALIGLVAVGATTVLAPEPVPEASRSAMSFDASALKAPPAVEPYGLPAPSYPAAADGQESAPTF